MDSSKETIFDTGTAPSKDWFLQFLVNLANKEMLELELTLTVGGTLISGELASVREYFDTLGTYYASPLSREGYAESISDTFQKIGEQCSCVTPSEQTDKPSYIHMKNVHFSNANSAASTGKETSWWRGRLSEVQGFAPGKMKFQA